MKAQEFYQSDKSIHIDNHKEIFAFAEAYAEHIIDSISDGELELNLLKDKTYKMYENRAKEAYYFGAKAMQQQYKNKLK